MNVFVVGRHNGQIGDNTLVGQKNVTFSLNIDEVNEELDKIEQEALEIGADVIAFQATPGILFAAIYYAQRKPALPYYAIVSKPGKRESAKRFEFQSEDMYGVVDAKALAQFANPNVKFEDESDTGFTVVVDPPMKFEFAGLYRIY